MGETAATVVSVVIGLAIVVILILVFTLIFRWLWNTTMPDVFGMKPVNFWQALKILFLASILFGGPRVIERQVYVEPPGEMQRPS